MVVIGDSIAWGAGLTKYDKYSYLVAKWIAEQSNRPVNVKVLAHTGATLEKTADLIIKYPDLSSGNPTLMEQAEMISNPEDVDLILVSGGINDVKVDKIIELDYGPLFPGSTISDIRERSQKIEELMYELLKKLLRIYPKAKIVISGYYPIISEDSNGLTDAIKALYPISQFPTSDYKKLDDPVQLSELSTKSDAFYQDSNLGLFGAVLRANRESGKERIAFARITFPPDKCYGTDNSWLWKIEGIEGNYKTNDDKYDVRASLSQISGEAFKINYDVSSNCSEGLKQVELWRKDETSDWQEIKPPNTLAGESGPLSGSFTDSPAAPGKYWYGVHVVDNAGNWNDEKNSNTKNMPGCYGPVEVEIKEAQTPMSDSAMSWLEKGDILFFDQREIDAAIEAYDTAIELDPQNITLLHEAFRHKGNAWYSLGWFSEWEGDHDNETKAYDEASELLPRPKGRGFPAASWLLCRHSPLASGHVLREF
ncbi:MAG: GDSL-type esterase/lipase family protein, partial [Methanothrix sp.]|nr:GDSL-type esterase/lipase family protein [Methanothrix sp.]